MLHVLSLTKFSAVFPLQLNIHIVFEGEKEFHRNVKLWGVSIRAIFLFLKKKQAQQNTQTFSCFSLKAVYFSCFLCLLKEIQLHIIQ